MSEVEWILARAEAEKAPLIRAIERALERDAARDALCALNERARFERYLREREIGERAYELREIRERADLVAREERVREIARS